MGLRILIVDDSMVMRMMVQRNLRLAGFTLDKVIEAADGEDALKKFNAAEIDAVLSDLHMPKMDGYELARRIRQIPASTPILLITAEGSQAKIEDAVKAGVNAYLNKPPTPEELTSKLQQILPVK
ncbi:MAG: response regulator [Planctomycetes bacterium]|nr:response regulator [Planctomycetota bacterium]